MAAGQMAARGWVPLVRASSSRDLRSVELCRCPKLASADCSALGWAGRTCSWGGWGHTHLGRSQQIPALCTHPTPHSHSTLGEREEEAVPSAVFTDWPEKKPQQIMALSLAPTLGQLMTPPRPSLTDSPQFPGSLTGTPTPDSMTNHQPLDFLSGSLWVSLFWIPAGGFALATCGFISPPASGPLCVSGLLLGPLSLQSVHSLSTTADTRLGCSSWLLSLSQAGGWGPGGLGRA